MGSPGGVKFEVAWREKITERVEDVAVHYVSRRHLIDLKRAAGRDIDKRDIDALTASDPSKDET